MTPNHDSLLTITLQLLASLPCLTPDINPLQDYASYLGEPNTRGLTAVDKVRLEQRVTAKYVVDLAAMIDKELDIARKAKDVVGGS